MRELSEDAIERRRAYSRKYAENHREKMRENSRRYAKEHREQMREYCRKYRKEHREELNNKWWEKQRQWRREHPEEWREEKNAYYAKTQDAINRRSRWTEEEVEMIINKNGLTDHQISAKIGRSVKAIQVKRAKVSAGIMQKGVKENGLT